MSNDRLKFRVWDKFLEKMSETFHIFDFETDEIGQLFVGGLKVMPFDAEVMQWTGLYDSEGVEIYEGDLVEVKGHYYADNWVAPQIEPVIFSEGCFEFEWGPQELWDMCLNGYATVVGNRYQRPELMERANG